MSLDVRVDCDVTCFDLPEWRSLLASDPHRHVFATPEWHRLWWDEFSVGKELQILTMWAEEQLRAIVPLYLKTEDGRKILRFVGGIDLTDYLGPICALEDRAEVAAALVEWLSTTDLAWDELDAHNMPVPFGFAEFLVERADKAGLEFSLDQEETAALLPLPGDWAEYLAALESKERHELKRKRRRIEREHPDVRVRSTTRDTLAADLKTFVDMHRSAEGHKGDFMRPEVANFFERVATAFMERDWLSLDLLEIGDTALAGTFGFRMNNRFFLYNSAYVSEARRLSPGLMLVSELVRRSIEEGLEVFDFLRGPERYKYQLGAEAVPLNNVRISHPRV